MYKSNKIDKEYDDYRTKGFWEKVRDKFFLILLLFIISSCSQKRDVYCNPNDEGEFEREHLYLKEKISIPVRKSVNIEDW